MARLLSLLVLIGTISALAAQPGGGNKDKDKGKDKKEAARTDDEPSHDLGGPSGSAYIIVCDAQPGKMLVLDSSGRWLSGVRLIEMKVEPGSPTTISCTMWDGPIKPTKPQVKTWQLSQMKSVSEGDFQKMVDAVQSNPEAVKDLLTKKPD